MNLPLEQILLIALSAAVAVLLVLVIIVLVRGGTARLQAQLATLREDNERMERVLREEQRGGRAELKGSFGDFRAQVDQQLMRTGSHQAERLEQFTLHLRANLADLRERNDQRLAELRTTLETQLKALQADNQKQLDRMRETVDEKLQKTLEARLGESFRLVSAQLEAVQRGIGQMQDLATGVGDLRRVLTNVKTRGTFGEVQLGRLLEEMLAPDQYATNVATVPGSSERVEFALRMPGLDAEAPVWMPIDAKFPREDFERLQDAQERADAEAAQAAALALERRVREEAKTIHAKYVAPPATTEYALLFLPTESLYAEVLRRPGLFEALQREYRVTIASPTTLTAIINALQMGFRTLAIEQRSSEVWRLLAQVKGEFAKFGDILDKALRQLDSARNNLDELVGRRSRAIERRLRHVDSLDAPVEDEAADDSSDEPD